MGPGATALSALAAPLNLHILEALESGELPLADLSREVGHPPASTMRAYLRSLGELGVVERRREEGFPGSVTYSVTPSGERLLKVRQALQEWLRLAPGRPVTLGSPAAKSTTKALVDGWSSKIVRAIAARPCALTELDRLIPQISYPSLERRLTSMRQVGLLEAHSTGARVTPYKATAWLRHAVRPLTAAIAWERRFAPERTSPLGRVDVEAAFLLAVPLLTLPTEISGTCRLAVEVKNGAAHGYAGVVVTVEQGRPVSCVARLKDQAEAWAAGSPLEWFGWLNGYDGIRLDLGGDTAIAASLAKALHAGLTPADRANAHG